MKHKNIDPTKPILVSGPGGPRTESGKQISAQNSTKHGCCSTATLILPNERLEDFQSLERTWFRAYEPEDALEVHLLHQLVQADWFLQRANRTLADVECQIFIERFNPLDWSDRQHQAIQRFTRYQTTRRNDFHKAKKALDDHREMKASETAQVEKSAIAQQRLNIYIQKSQPQPTLEEQLEEMTRTAQALALKPAKT